MIKNFQINANDNHVTITAIKGTTACLSFEYLRVFTPNTQASSKQQDFIAHKKDVALMAIEHVGKHGYRLIFDDNHSAIYSADYITVLMKESKQRWQQYVTALKSSGQSRETSINIKQL